MITGNMITGITTGIGGVGVLVEGTFTMNGGRIYDNHIDTDAWSGGGGVFVDTGATFEMIDGEISNNTVANQGGGVFVDAGGTFTMRNGVISYNSSQGAGGVSTLGIFYMYGGRIFGHTIRNSGGVGVNSWAGAYGTFAMYRQSPFFLDLYPKTITYPEPSQAVSDYFLTFS